VPGKSNGALEIKSNGALEMKRKNLSAIVIIALAVLGSTAVAQQDRFTLRQTGLH
jgi:hypothetical protein